MGALGSEGTRLQCAPPSALKYAVYPEQPTALLLNWPRRWLTRLMRCGSSGATTSEQEVAVASGTRTLAQCRPVSWLYQKISGPSTSLPFASVCEALQLYHVFMSFGAGSAQLKSESGG